MSLLQSVDHSADGRRGGKGQEATSLDAKVTSYQNPFAATYPQLRLKSEEKPREGRDVSHTEDSYSYQTPTYLTTRGSVEKGELKPGGARAVPEDACGACWVRVGRAP
eukprot:scaffold11453_cov78-Skeletonema_dohrnii-CCMP3373.AAC.2